MYGAPQLLAPPRANGAADVPKPLPRSNRSMFVVIGSLFLALLGAVPVWNAFELLEDDMFLFFSGPAVPTLLIVACCATVILYAVTTVVFFHSSPPEVKTEQSVLLIGNVFITLLGLMMVLISLPLTRQSIDTYENLMHNCETSLQTHRLYEYYMVLQNIRKQPECKSKFSVEECVGYEVAPPFTRLLKEMEISYRCSGMCHNALAGLATVQLELNASLNTSASTASNATAKMTTASNSTAKAASALAQDGEMPYQGRIDHVFPLETQGRALMQMSHGHLANIAKPERTEALGNDTTTATNTTNLFQVLLPRPSYPPTLFSDAGYQASCQGTLARQMQIIAGDFGFQVFYQGVLLVSVAVGTGFLKLVGYCAPMKRRAAVRA